MSKAQDKMVWFAKRSIKWAARQVGKEHAVKRLSTRLYREVTEIRKLKDVGRGKRCFIIGNGPSLNRLDLNLLKGEAAFGVNGIFLKFDELAFKPTYYVVEDTLVAADRADEINRLRGMKKLFPRFLSHDLLLDEDTSYMNVVLDYSEYDDFPEFSTNAARCIWVGGTVTYLNLQLAFYFGYDPVVLIGIDHDYKVTNTGHDVDGCVYTSQVDDVNHFHPDYFGKGYRFHDPKVERMELAYKKARKVYEAHGRRILNATAGGKLEVFERVPYESLF